MEKYDVEALRATHVKLVKHLDINIIDHLYQEKILQDEHLAKIRSRDTPQAKNRLFLTILKTRGPTAYAIFLNKLPDLGQEHLKGEIEKNCVKFRTAGNNSSKIFTHS